MASLPDFAHQDLQRHMPDERRVPAAGLVAPGQGREKRCQILQGAREVFLACGFDGASMGEIARAAGVSKGTLYVYFPSKEELFAALVTGECQRTAEACFDMSVEADVREALIETSRRYVRAMLEPGHVRTVRMVIGVAEKLPEIGRAYLQAGQEAGVDRLTAWLRAKIARGELVIDDVELAAWQFLIGCHAQLVMPMMFGDETQPDAASIERLVAHTVDSFLRSFAAPRRSTSRAPLRQRGRDPDRRGSSAAASSCPSSAVSPSR